MIFARCRGILGIGLLALAAALPAAAQTADPPPAIATDARLGGDNLRTRLVIDLDRPVAVRAFTLADPYRVVIDLPDVNFQLPDGRGAQKRGLISAFRYGLFAPGKARIVIDATGPVSVDKAFVLDPIDDQPARLVVDLVKTDRATFLRTVTRAEAPRLEGERRPFPSENPVKKPDDKPVVVIDPGHGGLDPGATSAGRGGGSEKDIVLAFALRLQQKLAESGRYQVVMTRDTDTFVALGDRVKVARENGAALFVSVHADTLSDPFGVRGATVYTLSETASDEQAARLAEKENRADVIAGIDLSEEPEEVAGILIELAQRETKTFAMQFARTLVGELRTSLRLNKNPVRSAGFRVLRAPDVPSVLLELGYVSTKDDLKQLMSASWRERTADAMARAIDNFLAPRLAGASAKSSN
jgi:N-acetylmuramoyl-L-alanine amidase